MLLSSVLIVPSVELGCSMHYYEERFVIKPLNILCRLLEGENAKIRVVI